MRSTILHLEAKARQLALALQKGRTSFEELLEDAPGGTHRNNTQAIALDGYSPYIKNVVQYELEEIAAMGDSYLETILHPDDVAYCRQTVVGLVARNDFKKQVTFIQRGRGKHDFYRDSYTALLTTSIYIPETHDIFSCTVRLAEADAHLARMIHFLGHNRYIHHHFPAYRQLTGREIEVLRLLTEGHSLTQIADGLSIAAETIKTHLKHIRSKTGMATTAELVKFALAFGLARFD